MNSKVNKITEAEAEIMRVVWEYNCPVTYSQIRTVLSGQKGWESPTVNTLVNRLVKKGILSQEKKEVYYYTPAITEEEYMQTKTQSFIQKVYNGNVKGLMSALLTYDGITREDLDELTHYRRMDFLYKWLAKITVCFHWFNPSAYWVRRQINRDCEFSCDEAVVSCLNDGERRIYGSTLLNSIDLRHSDKKDVVSLSLNEDSRLLKERLCEIMKYKRKSKSIVFFTFIVTFVLICSAAFTGAYKVTAKNSSAGTIRKIANIRKITRRPQNKDNAEDNIYEMDENGTVTIPVSFSGITKDYICLGQIPNLNNAVKITYNVSAKTGDGLVVGMQIKPDPKGSAWYNYYANTNHISWSFSGNDNIGKDISYLNNYYLYVGTIGTPLKNINGTITIQYDMNFST